jgi:hypothetical protein
VPGYPSGQREQTVNLLAHAFLGSNPSPGTIADVAQPRRGPVGAGRGFDNFADVAQLVEHLHGKEGVTGSIPVVGSSLRYLW